MPPNTDFGPVRVRVWGNADPTWQSVCLENLSLEKLAAEVKDVSPVFLVYLTVKIEFSSRFHDVCDLDL